VLENLVNIEKKWILIYLKEKGYENFETGKKENFILISE
jgi:hypothetical protein